MRNIFKLAAGLTVASAGIAATNSSAADFDVASGPVYVAPAPENGFATFIVSGNPFSGPLTAGISRTGASAGTWTDRFIFRIGQDGLGSGTVSTSFAAALSTIDTDLKEIDFFNGLSHFTIPIETFTGYESAGRNNIPIFSGLENVLSITYLSRGNGSYGGQLSFVPSAVPEPAAWLLMVLGFAGIGMMMRRSRKRDVRIRYAF